VQLQRHLLVHLHDRLYVSESSDVFADLAGVSSLHRGAQLIHEVKRSKQIAKNGVIVS
jgi:hypothetical protein